MNQKFDLRKPTHLIALFLLLFVLLAIPLTVISVLNSRDQRSEAANTTSIYLQPGSQTINVNADLVLQVRENSGTTPVTTAEITLNYDATRLDFIQLDPPQASDPFATAIDPATSTGGGVVSFVRIVTQQDNTTTTSVTGDKLIATVRFRARQVPGATNISIANTSKVYGSSGLDETSTRNGGTYTVVDNPPAVSLTSPSANAHVRQTINLTADATDNLGVSRVEFYRGATLINTDTTATGNTYSVPWNTTGVADGSYSLTARAFDINGSTTSNPAVTVTVDNTPPTSVVISGVAAKVKGTVAVSATATDTNLEKIEFRVDGGAPTSDNSSPYTFNWDTTLVTNASHTLSATAFDRAGNQTTTSLSTTVDNQGPSGFTLSGTVVSQTQINLTWTASIDALSGPVTYDVYRSGTKITPTTITTTTYQATGLTAGTTYTFMIRAIDTLGNTTDSNILSIATQSPPKVGDFNLDNKVNTADLAILVATWGSTTDLRADLSNDGRVNTADLAKLVSVWGT